MLIQGALNGGRARDEHPAVPITPEELAASARECLAAGAGAFHFHVRARDGRESLAPDDVASAVSAVRAAVPTTPFGVSTGAWILHDTKRRYEAVSQWKILPDYASINFKEEGAVELAHLLLSRGIGIEAGFTSTDGINIFLASGVAPRCMRLLLEPTEEQLDAAMANVAGMEAILEKGGVHLPRILHGFNTAAWQMIDAAAARGYHTRIGLEDVLTLPNGSRAPSNAGLVAEAARRTHSAAGILSP